MLDRTNDNVADRVASLVRRAMGKHIGKQPITKPIGNDDDLRASGLSSLGLVNLMLSVEAEFDFTIPQDEITPENFQSVQTLQAMIVQQLRHEQAA